MKTLHIALPDETHDKLLEIKDILQSKNLFEAVASAIEIAHKKLKEDHDENTEAFLRHSN